jgi:multidrug efflux pump subunit AcrB
MTGIMGKFLFMIPVVVVLAFLASAFEAFCILPGHVVELVPFGRPITAESEDRGWYRPVQRVFRGAVGWAVRHRLRFLGILVAVLAGTVLLARWRLRFVLFPPGLVDQFFLQLDMPEGTSLTATEAAFRPIEDIIRSLPPEDLDAVTSTIGQTGWEQEIRLGTQYAQARVFLTPEENRKRRTDAIIRPPARRAPDLR